MEKYVITITRQFGSMGRPIAKIMSELLHIQYYDRDIVDETAKSLHMPVSVISNQEEMAKSAFFNMKFPLGVGTTEIQNTIYLSQQQIINRLVEKESCIIVGRCSDYILKNSKNSLHIYIYAPYEVRYENCIKELMMEPSEAKKMITEVDKARDSYHMRYAGYLPYDYTTKDIMIDSSLLGVQKTAECLVDIIRKKYEIGNI